MAEQLHYSRWHESRYMKYHDENGYEDVPFERALQRLSQLPLIPLKYVDPVLRENLIKLDIAVDYVLDRVNTDMRCNGPTKNKREYAKAHSAAKKLAMKLNAEIDQFLDAQDLSADACAQLAKRLDKHIDKGRHEFVQHRGGGMIALNVLVGLTGIGALIIAVHALVTHIKEGVARPLAKTETAREAETLKKITKQIAKQQRYEDNGMLNYNYVQHHILAPAAPSA